METSRDKITETEGATSIRLRYSRQFQSGGHAHTIDAEAMLAIGASSERRDQVIRELETGVEQLARQIVQRGSRVASEARPQAPVRSGEAPSRPAEPSALPRPASIAAQPTAPLPVSESMPATPSASGERTINLPYFLDYIKKRWDMSRQEAMELLGVRELTGLNYREALFTLRAIKEPNSSPNSNSAQTRSRATGQQPVVEAPRQTNRPTPAAPNTRPPSNQTTPGTTTALKHDAQAGPRAAQTAPVLATAPEPGITMPEREREALPDFAGSSKAPLPIQLGVVRDMVPRSYGFQEEDEDEEEYDLPDDDDQASPEGSPHKQAAERRLERLKELRTGNAASPERLNVLNNVIGEQISEEQLGQIIEAISGSTNKKRLKIQQVEELISWAKEDYFAEEVSAILEPFDEGEE